MFTLVISVLTSFAQLGIGTTPDSSAMLDVFSDTRGFLPPRIALTATNVAAPVTKPATGLLVYNTATAGTDSTRVVPGYYYWNGTSWFPVDNKGKSPGDMQYWNGNQWLAIPVGVNGSVLTLCDGVPRWGDCPVDSLVLRPANNPNEAYVYSYYPNNLGIGTSQLPVMAWTHDGFPSTSRAYMKFDFNIPAGATIISAKLSLYAATPNPNSGNLLDAHYGTNNAMFIRRVTAPWTGNAIKWVNQAPATATNQVVLPHTPSATQNDLNIDVTQLVKDMQQNGNYGFCLGLVTENYYNSRQYMSSYNPDATKHPKLVIKWKL